jgi:hypothetical protein
MSHLPPHLSKLYTVKPESFLLKNPLGKHGQSTHFYLGKPTLPLTVSVEQSDLDAGAVQSCTQCPVAIAAIRATAGTLYVECHESVLQIGSLSFRLPMPVRVLVAAFDDEIAECVKPLTFTLTEKDVI